MLRKFVKGTVEAYRWRWLNMETELCGLIHNVTIRTIVTALWFAVQFVISDILFGWLGIILAFTKIGFRIYEEIIEENTKDFGLVLSWEEES
jgi:hypothetical protein